jgi:hypothetical protein
MSTDSTIPAPPRLSRTGVVLLIGATVVIALVGIGLRMGSGAGGHTSAPSAPPAVHPAAPPSARPSGVPYYTKDEMEVLKEQARQAERNRIAIEQQYGK